MYQRGQRTRVDGEAPLPLGDHRATQDRSLFERGYRRLYRLGLPVRSVDESWRRWME